MHIGRIYSLREVVKWTRRETLAFLIIAVIPTCLYALLDWKWLAVPWVPVALIGTAVAFITGFKNNASYGRLWEARKIWGALINVSRFWGTQVRDFVGEPETEQTDFNLAAEQQTLVYRHLAFVTALRYQLRECKQWESQRLKHNLEVHHLYDVAEHDGQLEEHLRVLLPANEIDDVLSSKNRATQILAMQSAHLARLNRIGGLGEYDRVAMSQTIFQCYEAQGKSERIKNFPYPRQYATMNFVFIWLFIALTPFGLIRECDAFGPGFVWLTIPASMVVSWVFHTMEKIGESSENPFEGGPNDVPITALARTLEIDLREMLGETDPPSPVAARNNILT